VNVISLDRAVALLLAGEPVAIPTETVYGLACDAANPRAIKRLYALKGRPADHPVIVHVADVDALEYWACEVPPIARALAAAFWPGPLTLILRRAAHVSDAVTGGQDTVGLRCPAHPLALALLEACEAAGIRGLAAPSANRFGHVSPTVPAHVEAEFGGAVPLLDGGTCAVGIESTIVDLSGAEARILRPGMLDADALSAVITLAGEAAATDIPRVSGSLAAHYAPDTALEIVSSEALRERIVRLSADGLKIGVLTHTFHAKDATATPERLTWLTLPQDPAGYARGLYAALRAADVAQLGCLLVESVPEARAWAGVRDRLARAACGSGRALPK
jgi:L-threonylcarbamoyladenylate synthase